VSFDWLIKIHWGRVRSRPVPDFFFFFCHSSLPPAQVYCVTLRLPDMPRKARKDAKRYKYATGSYKRATKRMVTRSHPAGDNSLFVMPSVLPPRVLVPHTYTANFQQIVLTGTPVQLDFRLNSLYDLEFGNEAKNTQPRGYDRMSSGYSFYMVRKAKIEVSLVPGLSTTAVATCNTLQYAAAARPGALGTMVPPPVNYLGELPGAKQGTVGIVNGHVNFTQYVDLLKLTGLGNGKGANAWNTGIGALAQNNPIATVWWTLALLANGSALVPNQSEVSIMIKFTLLTEWQTPKYDALVDDGFSPKEWNDNPTNDQPTGVPGTATGPTPGGLGGGPTPGPI